MAVRILGADEVKTALASVRHDLAYQGMRYALRKGATYLLSVAKAEAPVLHGYKPPQFHRLKMRKDSKGVVSYKAPHIKIPGYLRDSMDVTWRKPGPWRGRGATKRQKVGGIGDALLSGMSIVNDLAAPAWADVPVFEVGPDAYYSTWVHEGTEEAHKRARVREFGKKGGGRMRKKVGDKRYHAATRANRYLDRAATRATAGVFSTTAYHMSKRIAAWRRKGLLPPMPGGSAPIPGGGAGKQGRDSRGRFTGPGV